MAPMIISGKTLTVVDAIGLNKIQGKPFAVREVIEKIQQLLKN